MSNLDSRATHEDAPDVPTAGELFGGGALERLRCSRELADRVEELRASEALVAGRAKAVTQAERLRTYTELVDDILSGTGVVIPADAYGNPTGFFEAVASLPFASNTAKARRKAREVARVAMLSGECGLYVPERAEELHGLWEQAMLGEPRWSASHPSSAFRTGAVVVRGPWPERVIVHRCMDACEVPAWLDRLLGLLSDESFAPELRAACGLGLLDWIHPFADGNGHTGRLLMLAMLGARYSQPTKVCLANELVVNRVATVRQFRRLRERKADAADFCLGMLGQVGNAQEHALNMLAVKPE